MNDFYYKGRNFYKNGKIHHVYSGAIHYFRVMPFSWKDRLLKLKNCGFNTVETYICWSLHEREEGDFDFSGILDFGAFIDTAKEVGLDVIIRPGPYICAETDFGGFPSWLFNYSDLEIRSNNKIYIEKVKNYLKEIASIITPRLITNGGNIIMMQVENEYGSYGNDEEYKKELLNIYHECGFDCVLFTADGDEPTMLQNGHIEGVLQTLTFGSNPKNRFEILKDKIDQPLMCAEYWNGWFNVYGQPNYIRSPKSVYEDLEEFLELDASFNFYMFCGGTNFNMINGANYFDGNYRFQTTGYDYIAPLNEAGDMTEKYYGIKEILEKHTGEKIDLPVFNSKKITYPTIQSNKFVSLVECISKMKYLESSYPMTFEKLGVDFGYVFYETTAHMAVDGKLKLRGLRDRATVQINKKIEGIYSRETENSDLTIGHQKDVNIGILVENRGRCNYGPQLRNDIKGILNGVILEDKFILGFKNYPLSTELPKNLSFHSITEESKKEIGYYLFELTITEECADTYIYPKGFKNGCIFINGVNIGRYCNWQPPQRTLYLPGGLLKKGKNDIVLFETDGIDNPIISFSDKPIYIELDQKKS